jgi:hypothetical protein
MAPQSNLIALVLLDFVVNDLTSRESHAKLLSDPVMAVGLEKSQKVRGYSTRGKLVFRLKRYSKQDNS